jgi:hypothetical protein
MPREAITQPASRIEAWADQVIDELMADIPAADVRARLERGERIEAAITFAIRRRRLGPCPAVWRSPPSERSHYWLTAYNEKLELWTEGADERTRELAAEAELFMPVSKSPTPTSFLMGVGYASYMLQGDPAKSLRANAIDLAPLLGVEPSELEWLLKYVDLLSAYHRVADRDLFFGFYTSLRVIAAVLVHNSAPAVMHPAEGARWRVIELPAAPIDPASLS